MTALDGLTRVRVVQAVRGGGLRELQVARRAGGVWIGCDVYVVRHTLALLHGSGPPPDGLTRAYVDDAAGVLYLPPAPSGGIDHGDGAPPDTASTAWVDDTTSVLHVPYGTDPWVTLTASRGEPTTAAAPTVDPDQQILYLTEATAL